MHFLRALPIVAFIGWLCLLGTGAGCKRIVVNPPEPPPSDQLAAASAESPVADSTPAPALETPPPTPAPVARKTFPPPPPELWKQFSGARAMDLTQKLVALGPRPTGSPEIEKARRLVTDALQRNGWDVVPQPFTAEIPGGKLSGMNLIARFSASGIKPVPQDQQHTIVGAHFDTKKFSTIRFVGANDGASAPGSMIELARVLAMHPALAETVELVFFDASEALTQFTEADGLYGSRAYIIKLRDTGRLSQFHRAMIWNLIGSPDLVFPLPPDTPPTLIKSIQESAESLGLRSLIREHPRAVWSDHRSLTAAGIPTIALGDWDYVAYHTADDLPAKLSVESIQAAGMVTVHWIGASKQ